VRACVINGGHYASWNMLPVAKDMKPAFEIWSSGDEMADAQGTDWSVQGAAGKGWLGLNNGVGSKYQSPGITRTVATLAGAQYTFSLDYAGQLGLTGANTQIGVYLDGNLLGSYSNTSLNALNWQQLVYRFTGDGKTHTLSLQLTGGTDTSTPCGAMIGQLSLIETLPESASTAYGFAGSPIALPGIVDQLAANDPGVLETTIVGLPEGAVLSDGVNSATVADKPVLNVTGWNLNSLTLTVPRGGKNRFNLQIVATSVEGANGSMAAIAKDVTVQLLAGQACATPVGVNPYVSYVNSLSATQTAIGKVVASPLVPVSSSYTIVTPPAPAASATPTSDTTLDASAENLLENLSLAVGMALLNELDMLTQKQ
jgi:hypothetical protein